MSPATIGLIGIAALLILILSGWPIAFCMISVGFLGYAAIGGFNSAFYNLGLGAYSQLANFNMVMLPLFMLMSMVAVEAGISGDLYQAGYCWVGQIRGGLTMATVLASTFMGAITSDEVSTASAMGKAAFPEMQKYNYAPSLAAACIAAGGTIATLIPPSASFIIYGILTEVSIGRLFMAGIFPGLIEAVVYLATIYILCTINPKLGPAGPKTPFKQKVASLGGVGPVLAIFLLVMGGIYLGVFTPSEAGAIGALGVFIVGFSMKRLSRQGIIAAFLETGRIVAMVGILIAGAMIFTRFMAITKIPFALADFVVGLEVNRYVVLIVLLAFYVFLGCFLSVLMALFLTLPIIFPLILALDFNPVWYGVLMARMIEIGTITPPIGMVLFVLTGVIKVPIGTIYRGVFPFVVADIIIVAFLVAFPQISLWLPTMMKGA